jgi:hypothetical protein
LTHVSVLCNTSHESYFLYAHRNLFGEESDPTEEPVPLEQVPAKKITPRRKQLATKVKK